MKLRSSALLYTDTDITVDRLEGDGQISVVFDQACMAEFRLVGSAEALLRLRDALNYLDGPVPSWPVLPLSPSPL